MELAMFLQSLNKKLWTDNMIDQIFTLIDVSKDGKIQFDEFISWVFGLHGEDQDVFRHTVGMDSPETLGAVNVTVLNQSGNIIYGPEEFLGSFSVASVRREVKRETGHVCGGLLLGNDESMRDHIILGAYCSSP